MSIAQRLQWILAHRTREDGSPWKPTPLSLAAGLGRNHVAQITAGKVVDPDLSTIAALVVRAFADGVPDDDALARLASSIGVRVVRRELGGLRAVLAPGVLFVSA